MCYDSNIINIMLNEAQIKVLLAQMTENERLKVIQMCNNENNKIKIEDIYNKLSNNYKCPHCGSNKICKNGFLHNKYQQFKCHNCNKNYSIRTNTIFCKSKKNIQLWQEYIELFTQGKYLDYCASYFQSMKSKIDMFNMVLNSNLQYGIVDIRNKRVCFEKFVNL